MTAVPEFRAEAEAQERLADLRMHADLTAEQIGRLLGVTARTVYGWLDGTPIPARHTVALDGLRQKVLALPGGNPAARHTALLDSSAGPSLFGQWMAALPQGAELQVIALSAADLLAA